MSADQDATHAQGGNGADAAHPIYERERRAQMIEELQRNVPHELRECSAWLLWKAKPKDGRQGEFDKVPWYASGRKRHGQQGSAQDLEQLTDFAGAMAALRNHGQDFGGVGFALLPCHPISALDLDHVDKDDARRALAAAVLDSGTYVETSPSGQGRRAFFADKLGFGNVKNHNVGVEVFETAGFVTVTGAELSAGVGLAPMPEALRARLAALLSTPKERSTPHAQPSHATFDLASLPRPLAERLRRGFRTVPLNTRVIVEAESAATAYWIGSGKPKPLTAGALDAVELPARKCGTTTVFTKETLALSIPKAEPVVTNILTASVSRVLNQSFIGSGAGVAGVEPPGILNNITAIAATGDPIVDLSAQIEAFEGNFSTAYYVMRPSIAVALAVGADSSGGDIVLLDGSQILFGAGDIEVAAGRSATLEMLDNPTNDSVTPTSTTMISMFQTDSLALRVERFSNWQVVRPGAISWLSGANYGST